MFPWAVKIQGHWEQLSPSTCISDVQSLWQGMCLTAPTMHNSYRRGWFIIWRSCHLFSYCFQHKISGSWPCAAELSRLQSSWVSRIYDKAEIFLRASVIWAEPRTDKVLSRCFHSRRSSDCLEDAWSDLWECYWQRILAQSDILTVQTRLCSVEQFLSNKGFSIFFYVKDWKKK